MKQLVILILFSSQLGYTQSKALVETINEIEFTNDSIKSVYDWVAYNIRYDVNKFNEIQQGSRSDKNSSFATEEAYKEHLLKQVIKRRKGVCEDYSLLFNSILKELGYESVVVEGYTKNLKGRVVRSIGHTWNAVKVNNEWKLYDPTWGAGYVEEEKKFVQKYSMEWYEVDPDEMLKTHIPYDPIWQLSTEPMSYQNFEANSAKEIVLEDYNFKDLIEDHRAKDKKLQMQDQVKRSMEMGDGIRLIDKWRRRMTKNIGIYGITSQQDQLDEANENSNKAVELFNEYAACRNKQFKGKKWTIDIARQYLEDAKLEVESAHEIFSGIVVDSRSATNSKNKALKQSEKLLVEINNQLRFIENLKKR